jgi:hypothetical protein
MTNEKKITEKQIDKITEKQIDKIKSYAMSAASLLEDIDGKDFEGMLDILDDAKDDLAQATKEIDAILRQAWSTRFMA